MEMADAKDIDDGATVAGAMDELLEKDSQLEAPITEIEFKENLLIEKSSALEAERIWSESLANELAALRLLQQTILSQEAQPALPPQPAATVSFSQDRSESAASDSAAKEPTPRQVQSTHRPPTKFATSGYYGHRQPTSASRHHRCCFLEGTCDSGSHSKDAVDLGP
ncbi:unnamed protein product [Cylindrotheca closterium]|uniref:Uncharacterized protein n=1 Tax=Cylindrotheca closterium TaxID=2856 RepID=A0AAD2JID9_9STRA|nr:unnamed protein product [Cylindrotheca closterium]